MTNEDPVPLLPPHFDDVPGMALGVAVPALVGFTFFVHPAGGLSLGSLGAITKSELPVSPGAVPVLDVATWLLNAVTNTSSPHNIAEYVLRLGLAASQVTTPHQDRPTPAPREQRNPSSQKDATRAERAAVDTIFRVGSQQQAQPAGVQLPSVRQREGQGRWHVWGMIF
jgi:hypothetical protein